MKKNKIIGMLTSLLLVFSTFTGNFTIVNGVSVYNSSLFRGSGAYLDGRYIKRKGVLGCNNQANDGACEKYSQIIVTD